MLTHGASRRTSNPGRPSPTASNSCSWTGWVSGLEPQVPAPRLPPLLHLRSRDSHPPRPRWSLGCRSWEGPGRTHSNPAVEAEGLRRSLRSGTRRCDSSSSSWDRCLPAATWRLRSCLKTWRSPPPSARGLLASLMVPGGGDHSRERCGTSFALPPFRPHPPSWRPRRLPSRAPRDRTSTLGRSGRKMTGHASGSLPPLSP